MVKLGYNFADKQTDRQTSIYLVRLLFLIDSIKKEYIIYWLSLCPFSMGDSFFVFNNTLLHIIVGSCVMVKKS